MAALEGGAAALAVSSGAAAVSYAIQALAKAGEHIVASRNIYGGTYHLLAHTLPLTAGITATFVDPEEEGAFEGAIQEIQRRFYRDSGKSAFQCGGSGDTFKDRTQSSDPSGGGFHICDALPGAAHRVRSGYCGTLGDEIYRRAWDGPWRVPGRLADGLTGKRLGNIPGFPKQIPAITESLLQRRRRKRHLRLMSGGTP